MMDYMYFNNAGAGLMSEGTYKTVIDHMDLERNVGAYKAATIKSDAVNNCLLYTSPSPRDSV